MHNTLFLTKSLCMHAYKSLRWTSTVICHIQYYLEILCTNIKHVKQNGRIYVHIILFTSWKTIDSMIEPSISSSFLCNIILMSYLTFFTAASRGMIYVELRFFLPSWTIFRVVLVHWVSRVWSLHTYKNNITSTGSSLYCKHYLCHQPTGMRHIKATHVVVSLQCTPFAWSSSYGRTAVGIF